jgi:acyl-CoA synthetase (AMP-forming)/AMP-acid ligase II
MKSTNLTTQVAQWTRIDEALAWHALRSPDAPCVSFEGRHWSWAEFNGVVDSAARALRACGLVAGDRIALLSTPRPEYLVVLMAASRIGAVYVGLNPRYKAAEVAEAVRSARPRLIISLCSFEGQDFLELIHAAAATVELPPVVAFDSVETCLDALQALPAAPASSSTIGVSESHAPARDAAAIVFTSGTTGRPKAAMLTHRGLLHAAAVQHLRLNPKLPRYLCNLPVNHVGCLMNLTLAALVGGGSIVFLQRFSAAASLQLIRDERVNCWLQVPAMFHECVRDPSFDPQALRHLHSICIGGGAVSVQTLAKLRQIGAPLFVEYGQTETTSSAAYSEAGASDEVLTHCIGRFDPHFEFRIADVQNRPCAIDEVGEIQGRGALIFAGYYADPAATRDAFTSDGWLRTGDLALQRSDGNVVLQGRLKEMIKTGGYNVYPREVEQVIEAHPGIAQVVVLALPDEQYGEAVHAVISCRDESTRREALIALCRAKLANYKVPKSFRVVQAFPLLANGKIDRVGTRAMAAALPALD